VVVPAAGGGQRFGGGTPKALREVGGVPEPLRVGQTPQGFRRALLERAHAKAPRGPGASDDAGLVEALGVPVHVVPGRDEALKVTHPLDLLLADALLAAAGART
jgi:2-C-methyl-D-erythritol 4-phosphate cytidylyltransferase